MCLRERSSTAFEEAKHLHIDFNRSELHGISPQRRTLHQALYFTIRETVLGKLSSNFAFCKFAARSSNMRACGVEIGDDKSRLLAASPNALNNGSP